MTRKTPRGSERRRHARSQLGHYLPVALREWGDFSVWGKDVSRGGVGLKTEHAVELGDRFLLGLPGHRTPVEAEVCSVQRLEEEGRFAVGLRWVPRDAATRARLQQYCDESLP